MSIKHLLASAVVVVCYLFPVEAAAVDRGRWLCTSCSITSLPTDSKLPPADELVIFIKSDVNPNVFKQVPGVIGPATGWVTYDKLTICDGSSCIPLFYHPSGTWWVLGPAYTDSGSGYKNAGGSSYGNTYVAIDAGGNFPTVTFIGKWYIDVLYIDGVRVFESKPYFEILEYTVSPSSIIGKKYSSN